MTKAITTSNDALEIYGKSGIIRLRLKEGITRKTLLDQQLKDIDSKNKLLEYQTD